MNTVDFVQGYKLGLITAAMLVSDDDLLEEKEVIEMLRYKTKTMFLRELVMCENPKLYPVIFGKMSKRKYRRGNVQELINKHQFTYDYAGAQRRKHSVF